MLSALLSARLAARRGLAGAAVLADAERTWAALRRELEALEAQLREPGRSVRALEERLGGALGAARASLARAEQLEAERAEQKAEAQEEGEEEGRAELHMQLQLPIVQLGQTAPVRMPLGDLSNAVLATRFERQLAHILWTMRDDKD